MTDSVTTTDSLVFDSEFLAKLEQLYLLSRKIFRGQHRAERRSRELGSSLEFADYRNYSPGDDLRTIDWNIYGRLERLFVKLFEEEQDLHIHFLIDASASMLWLPALEDKRPPGRGAFRISKFDQARRIAASLAYIGLANLDRVNVCFFSDSLGQDMGIARGKSQFHKVLEYLMRTTPGGRETRLLETARQFSQRVKRPGLVFILSDFFDADGHAEALDLLRYSRFSVHVVQLLHAAEMQPELLGDLRLVDAETNEPFEITADQALLQRYRASFEKFVTDLETSCRKRAVDYAQAMAHVPFEDLVLRVFRNSRLLK